MIIGKPIEPMLVAESGASEDKFGKIIKKHKGTTLAEVKYDGYRIQVHKGDKLSLFTSNLNPLNPEVFPDLKPYIKDIPNGIYDGELVGFGNALEGYTAVKKRVRDTLDLQLVKEYPLQVRFFDFLQLGNKELITLPLTERRKILENNVGNYSEQEEITDSDILREKFQEVTGKALEGLVCKNPDSQYNPGSRTKDWIKLKNFITLDFVVLGVYKGKEDSKVSDLPFAGVLLGTRNGNKFETIVKVGMPNKEMVETLYERIKPFMTAEVPNSIVLSPELQRKTYARKVPAYYVQPEKSVMIETQFLNISRSENWHSCGLKDGEAYSLRIATLQKLRFDKLIKNATTTEQVAEIYAN
jgi:ATP-dependent DNA ligase